MVFRKPGVPIFGLWVSPINVLFSKPLLTERGLQARRWYILSMVGFLLFWTIGVLVGIVTGIAIPPGR
jgi:hypothetical protein